MLPFISINEAIFAVLDTWPPEWYGPYVVGRNETTIQKQKDKAKCLAQQKKNKQHVVEVWAAREAVQASTGKVLARRAATTEDESSSNVTIGPGTDIGMEGVAPTTTSSPLK